MNDIDCAAFASALDIVIPPGAIGWHISASWG